MTVTHYLYKLVDRQGAGALGPLKYEYDSIQVASKHIYIISSNPCLYNIKA